MDIKPQYNQCLLSVYRQLGLAPAAFSSAVCWVSCFSPAGWPVPAHSVAICEGLEDWGATDLSNISDSEDDDQPAPLVRFYM